MLHKTSFLCLIASICISCSQVKSNAESGENHLVNFDELEQVDELRFSSVFKRMHTIILETNEQSLIGFIDKISICGDYIVIADDTSNKGIWVFTTAGRYVGQIGTVGGGPGEYTSPGCFTVDQLNNEIYVLDSYVQKIHKYKFPTGEYLSTINILKESEYTVHEIVYINGSLYANAIFSSDDEDFLLQKINPSTGERVETFFSALRDNKGWGNKMKISSSSFHHTGKRWLFGQAYMDFLAEIDGDSISTFLSLAGENMMSEKEVKMLYEADSNNSLELQMKLRGISTLRNFIETDSSIIFNYSRGLAIGTTHFDLRRGKGTNYKSFFNDFLGKESNFIFPDHCGTNDNGAYYCYHPMLFGAFIAALQSGLVTEDIDKREELLQLNEDSNPVLFFCEFK